MYPILFRVGDFILPSWHVFYVLAGLVAWYLLQKLRPILFPELESPTLDTIFIVSYFLGYIGARLFSLLHEGEYLRADFSWWQAPFQLGSMTLYGGVIAVSAFVVIYAKFKKMDLLGLSDLFIIPSLIAIGIGRIGCFLNGDDFGAVASPGVPWPLAMPIPSLGDDLFRYSVQIWETVFCWALSAFLYTRVREKVYPRGRISDIGIISYAAGRFVLEFFRGDDRGTLFSTLLSPAQFLGIIFVCLWLVFRMVSQRVVSNRA